MRDLYGTKQHYNFYESKMLKGEINTDVEGHC